MRPPRFLPQPLLSLAAAQEGLVNKAQCDAVGVNKHAVALLIRQGRWTRVARCVYDTDPEPVELRLREGHHDDVRRRAACTRQWARGSCSVGTDPSRTCPTGGVRSQRWCPRWRRRFRISPATRRLPCISDALRNGLLDEAKLQRVGELVRGRRGAAQVHGVFDLVDEHDGSTAETHARLSFIDNGVPPDGQQVTFVAGGVVLARVDFVWTLPDGRYVVVEIDGRAFHSGEAMLADDATRQNGLLATGRLIVFRFPAARALGDGGRSVGNEMAERLAHLGWRPGSPVGRRVDLGLSTAVLPVSNVGVAVG